MDGAPELGYGNFERAVLQGADQAAGEREESADEVEDAFEDYADQPERKQDEPDQRIEDDGQQRERPAEDDQNAEEQKFEHGNSFKKRYALERAAVPD